ncbi:hypothetical protein BJ912DRAFT_181668 [Pholiota molesta]|nr:hypothetical protein BJ912DRAFT_181668 [Pholiota molesta]
MLSDLIHKCKSISLLNYGTLHCNKYRTGRGFYPHIKCLHVAEIAILQFSLFVQIVRLSGASRSTGSQHLCRTSSTTATHICHVPAASSSSPTHLGSLHVIAGIRACTYCREICPSSQSGGRCSAAAAAACGGIEPRARGCWVFVLFSQFTRPPPRFRQLAKVSRASRHRLPSSRFPVPPPLALSRCRKLSASTARRVMMG